MRGELPALATRQLVCPHFLVTRFIGDVRHTTAVGRVALEPLAPRRRRDLRALADSAFGGHDHDLAMHVHRHVLTGGRRRKAIGTVGRGHGADVVLLRVGGDAQIDLARRSPWRVHHPQVEVVFVDQVASVGGDGRELHAILFVFRHLRGRTARGGDLPQVEDAVAFRGKVDHAVGTPHRMHVVREALVLLEIRVGDLRDLPGAKILDGDVRVAVAAIPLSPVRRQRAVEGDHRGVLLHHAGAPEVHRHRTRGRTIEGQSIQR